jgi:hypothetical protein
MHVTIFEALACSERRVRSGRAARWLLLGLAVAVPSTCTDSLATLRYLRALSLYESEQFDESIAALEALSPRKEENRRQVAQDLETVRRHAALHAQDPNLYYVTRIREELEEDPDAYVEGFLGKMDETSPYYPDALAVVGAAARD